MDDATYIRFYSPIPTNPAQSLVYKMPPKFVGVVELSLLDQFNRVPDHPTYIRAYGPGRFVEGVTLLRDELIAHMPSLDATFPAK